MTYRITTALALILALGATPALAQDTGTDTGTSTETDTETDSGETDPGSDTPISTDTETETDAGTTTTTMGTGTSLEAGFDVTVEQQTEIRTAVTELAVEPVGEVDFDISIGVTVPDTITLHPLPARVVQVLPDFEGFLFFLLPDGRIVIVDPDSLVIVFIIDAD